MPVEIVWTQAARFDLKHLRDYIGMDNPKAASRVSKRILEAVELVSKHPSIGKMGRVPGTRELVVNQTPYWIAYAVLSGRLNVLRVMHSAKKWP